MPITINRIQDEPIIVSTFTGKLKAEDLAAYFFHLQPVLDMMEGHVYLISYIPDVHFNLDDLLEMLHFAKPYYAAAEENPLQTILFVGSSALVHVYQQALAKPEFGGVNIPMFTTLEAAFACIAEQQTASL